jgi:hypothetical protein
MRLFAHLSLHEIFVMWLAWHGCDRAGLPHHAAALYRLLGGRTNAAPDNAAIISGRINRLGQIGAAGQGWRKDWAVKIAI